LEFTAKLGPSTSTARWAAGSATAAYQPLGAWLIAGHEFNERLELYAEIYDLQEINRMKTSQSSASYA